MPKAAFSTLSNLLKIDLSKCDIRNDVKILGLGHRQIFIKIDTMYINRFILLCNYNLLDSRDYIEEKKFEIFNK